MGFHRTHRTAVRLLALLLLAAPALQQVQAQPSDESQRYRLAQGYEASGDYRNASRVYRELYERDPRSNVYFDGIRRTYMALKQYDELLPLVEARMRRLPNDVALHVQFADLLNRNQRRDDAMREWAAAIALRSDDPVSYQLVAQSQIDNRLLVPAAETYLLGRRTLNSPAMFADELAQIYGALARYKEASEEYLTMLEIDASRLDRVIGGMGLFTTNPDGADAAIHAAEQHASARPSYLPFLELLEWLYMERGNETGAFETAVKLDKARSRNGSDVYAFIDRALREGKFDAAIKAADYFQATYPKENALYASVVLASTKALEGAFDAKPQASRDDAKDLVERFLKIAHDNPSSVAAPEALFEAARLQADHLDAPSDAVATIAKLRGAYPRYPALGDALLYEADLHLRMGDTAKASELYTLGTRTEASDDDARRVRDLCELRSAELLFFAGNFKEASAAFAALAENPTSDVANDALAYQLLLQESLEQSPEALGHYAAGSLAMRRHAWSNARTEMQQAMALAPDGQLADEGALVKAEAEVMLGSFNDAMTTLLAVVSAHADGAAADRALYRAAEVCDTKLNDRSRAMELYNRLLAEYPNSVFVNTVRARIRALRGDG